MSEKRKVPPSRARYEKENPTVCFRVPLSTKERWTKDARERNVSLSAHLEQLFMGTLPGAEVGSKELGALFEKGYNKGYVQARSMYEILIPCRYCAQLVSIIPQNYPDNRAMVDSIVMGVVCPDCDKKRSFG